MGASTGRLRVDARFVADVSLPDGGLRRRCGLVWLDTGQLAGTRLAGPLRRFARLLTAQPRADEDSGRPVLLVLTRTGYRAEAWLTAGRDQGQAAAGRVDMPIAGAVRGRLAVCVGTGPSQLPLTGPVWRQPHTSRPVRLTAVLGTTPGSAHGWDSE